LGVQVEAEEEIEKESRIDKVAESKIKRKIQVEVEEVVETEARIQEVVKRDV